MRFGLVLVLLMLCVGGACGDGPVRVVDLVDFVERTGGAYDFGLSRKCRRTFEREGDVGFVRFDYDAPSWWIRNIFTPRIPEGTTQLEFEWRQTGAEAIGCNVLLVDAEGQYHRFAGTIPAGGGWSRARVDIGKPSASWKGGGGAADGQMHFPLRGVTLETRGMGCYDLAGIRAVTTAERDVLPDWGLRAMPQRRQGFWYPHETVAYDLSLRPYVCDAELPSSVGWELTDYWKGERIASGEWRSGDGSLRFAPDRLDKRFGSFKLTLTAEKNGRRLVRDAWFARLTGRDPKPCGWVGSIGGADWEQLSAIGMGVMNVGSGGGWRYGEPEKGKYRFLAGLETTVTNMLAHGIRPHMMIHVPNPVYENPLDPDAFAKFAAAFAKHFAAFGARDLEIWNEGRGVFRKQYGEKDRLLKFVEFSQKARDAIKAEVPEMTVMVCAEDMRWDLLPMLTNGIARAGDVISFHPYCHNQARPERGWFFRDDGEEFKAAARQFCGSDRFRISEVGWTTFTGKGEYLEVAGAYPRASYEHQAQYLIRSYLLARQAGVEYVCQYRFEDLDRREYTEHNFGFVFEDGTPKPSFAALAFMTRLLEGAETAGELSADRKRYRISSFQRGGRKILACWSVEGTVEWALPADFGRVARCYDLMGNVVEVPLTERGLVRLDERPIYLIGENARRR